MYYGLNIALCQVFAESEKNSEIDKNCGRQTSPQQAAPLYCTSSNAHLHPGLACWALPPQPPNPPNHPSLQAPTANAPSEAKGGLTGRERSLSVFNPPEQVGVLCSPYSVFPLLLLLIYDSTKRIELSIAKDVQDILKNLQRLEKTYWKRLDLKVHLRIPSARTETQKRSTPNAARTVMYGLHLPKIETKQTNLISFEDSHKHKNPPS